MRNDKPVPSAPTWIRREPLLFAALLVALAKSLQLAIDSTPLFFYDSGAFILNALGLAFIAERSYLYGWLIRITALPLHSLRATVALQVAMGGISAWLLAFALIRFLKTRVSIALAAALGFAFDPVQIVHEHMVMTETAGMLASALYLVGALAYLEKPAPWRLVPLAFLAMVLVGLRVVYLPVIIACAVILPLFAPLRPRTLLALALTVSCGATAIFQWGYRQLTGTLAEDRPAYHYTAGFFLLAAAAPLVRPDEIDDPRVAQAVSVQNRSGQLLSNPDLRRGQLWGPQSLAIRLISSFNGDYHAANLAAERLAWRAIRENPFGFLRLGLRTYFNYWQAIPYLRFILPWENGSPPRNEVDDRDLQAIQSAFGEDVSKQYLLQTPSRRYHIFGRYWSVFLLVSPCLGGLAAWLNRGSRGVAFLFAWSCLLLAATCLGTVELAYRYLHPFSFTGLAAVAVLLEITTSRNPAGKTPAPDKAGPAGANPDPAAGVSVSPPRTV